MRRYIARAAVLAPGAPLTACELGVRSQNGEDGVLQALFARLGTRSRYFVEFGIGHGDQGNCVMLADVYAWSGLFIEADARAYRSLAGKYARNPRVATRHELVTPDNVQEIFAATAVPPELDLLSIDIDGNDWWVWQAITDYRPRVVVAEYNANLPLDARLVMPRNDAHRWDATDYFGASLAAYCELADAKDYELVHTDSNGVNGFFVLRPEAASVLPAGGAPRHPANYHAAGITLPPDPAARPFLDLASGTLVEPLRSPGRAST
jgi:hypothetical protein